MKTKKVILSFIGNLYFALFCCVWGVSAGDFQKTRVLSLEESIDYALAKSWSIKAVVEKLNQAVEMKNQERSNLLPKFTTQYAYTRQDDITDYKAYLGVTTKDNYQWINSISQPVFAGFGLISSYRYASLGIEGAEVEIELSKLDLAFRVKNAYFNILVFDKTTNVVEKEVEFLASNVEVTNQYYKKRMIPVNDLLKAELELANARQKLVEAKNQAKIARSAFNVVLAMPVNSPLDVKDILKYEPQVVDFQETTDRAMKMRPEIKKIDIQIKQAEQQVKLAKSSYYPTIKLNYDYIKEGDEVEVSGSPYHDANRWNVALICSWPFWEWGKTNSTVNEKQSAVEELLTTRKAILNNITLEVKEAILYLDTAEKNIPTTVKAVQQGEENLRVNEAGYRAQVNTITDVLDAQALLTQARVNYYKARYGHHMARAKLLRAMGTY